VVSGQRGDTSGDSDGLEQHGQLVAVVPVPLPCHAAVSVARPGAAARRGRTGGLLSYWGTLTSAETSKFSRAEAGAGRGAPGRGGAAVTGCNPAT